MADNEQTWVEKLAEEIVHREGIHSICLHRNKRIAELVALINKHRPPDTAGEKLRRKVMNLTKKANWRVVVDVEEPILILGRDVEKATRRCCDKLIMDIKRHIDIDGRIEYEYDTVCAFCDSIWETETSKNDPDIPYGQPLCCEEAAAAWRKMKEANDVQT